LNEEEGKNSGCTIMGTIVPAICENVRECGVEGGYPKTLTCANSLINNFTIEKWSHSDENITC